MLPALDETYLSLKDIENGFRKCNSIRYAAYRTAAKLRVLQKAFHFDKVQLKIISCVFERHQLQQTENSVQLHQREAESALSDIYFAVKKGHDVLLDVDFFSQLMLNFLLNAFDKKMSKTIQVFSFKVGLTLLCEAKPREKYHYLFEQLADHNNCLSRKKLEILLKKMITLTEHLGEGLSFGSDLIPGTVESCFQCNIGSLGLSEDVFMSWLMQDPQLLVWLSTLYRMQISESVSHSAKCEICKVFPLVGLRYRCLRCLAYDMCQSCFFTGKLNKKHKLKHPTIGKPNSRFIKNKNYYTEGCGLSVYIWHPHRLSSSASVKVQEYCCPMTSQQSTKAFLLTLRNRLCKKDSKLQYLPALRVDSPESESMGESTRLLDEMEISSRTLVNGSRISPDRFPYKELQSIILQLERESEKIIPHVDNFCRCAQNHEVNECRTQLKNHLMKHNAQVRAQVQRLKLLRNYLASNGKFNAKTFLASTPVVEENSLKLQKGNLRVDLVNLSPISVKPSGRTGETNREMLWDNYELGAYHNPSWVELESGNCEGDAPEISELGSKMNRVEEAAPREDESELELSTLLSGKILRQPDGSFERGFSWLDDKENRKSEEEKIREENAEALEELQGDLRRILNKLQELTTATSRGEVREGEAEPGKKTNETDATTEVDALLVDLIDGIEKLMGN